MLLQAGRATLGVRGRSQYPSLLTKNPKLRLLERECRRMWNRVQNTNSEAIRSHLRPQLQRLTEMRRHYAFTARKVLKVQTSQNHRALNRCPGNILARNLKRLHKTSTRAPSLLASPEAFADHLRTQFQPVKSTIPTSNFPQPCPPANETPNDVLSARTVSMAIRDLKSGKSPGPNNVSIDLYKGVREPISHLLSRYFCFLLNTGTVPEAWKCAFIHPVPKKPSAVEPLTDTLRKVYERSLKDYVVSLIEPLATEQCGFRKGRGTLQQVAALQEDFIQFQHTHKVPGALAFLDISKAYDTVDRSILWQLCALRGLPLAMKKTLIQLFEGCTSQVVHKGYFSPPISHEAGLLQGSCLSPILYSLFINDIVEAAKGDDLEVKVYLFADDIALFAPNHARMQMALDRCTNFAQQRHFQFSPTKCAVLVHPVEHAPLSIQRVQLPEVHEFKYLGVCFTPSGID